MSDIQRTEFNRSNEAELGSVTQLFALAKNGDAEAFTPLWQRFFPRLVGLARQRLAGRPVHSGDAEDAAQAALVSFWKQLNSGEFLADLRRDSLWNLLAKFTVRKVQRQLRHDQAEKRGGGKLVNEADFSDDLSLDELAAALPTQELDAQAAEMLAVLPPDLQEIAVLRLCGHATAEIASRLDCTQRKVQRKLELVRLRWERQFGAG